MNTEQKNSNIRTGKTTLQKKKPAKLHALPLTEREWAILYAGLGNNTVSTNNLALENNSRMKKELKYPINEKFDSEDYKLYEKLQRLFKETKIVIE